MIKKSLVKIKEHLPYVGDMEGKVLLARVAFNPRTGEYSFQKKLPHKLIWMFPMSTISSIATTNGFREGSVLGVGIGLSSFILHGSLIPFGNLRVDFFSTFT